MRDRKVYVFAFITASFFSSIFSASPAAAQEVVDPASDPYRYCFVDYWFRNPFRPYIPPPEECGEPNIPEEPLSPPPVPEFQSSVAPEEGSATDASEVPPATQCFECALAICQYMLDNTPARCQRALTDLEEADDLGFCLGRTMIATDGGTVVGGAHLRCGPLEVQSGPPEGDVPVPSDDVQSGPMLEDPVVPGDVESGPMLEDPVVPGDVESGPMLEDPVVPGSDYSSSPDSSYYDSAPEQSSDSGYSSGPDSGYSYGSEYGSSADSGYSYGSNYGSDYGSDSSYYYSEPEYYSDYWY